MKLIKALIILLALLTIFIEAKANDFNDELHLPEAHYTKDKVFIKVRPNTNSQDQYTQTEIIEQIKANNPNKVPFIMYEQKEEQRAEDY